MDRLIYKLRLRFSKVVDHLVEAKEENPTEYQFPSLKGGYFLIHSFFMIDKQI